MPSPFPGMDPYLENPSLWPDVHIELISAMRGTLNRLLGARYATRIQERIYVSTDDDPGRIVLIPDVPIASRPAKNGSSAKLRKTASPDVAEPLVLETLLDEEVREPYLEVIDTANHKVVTVIEVLSPANKIAGSKGLESFRGKRDAIMRSHAHWVEIDLLRGGVSLALRERIRPHEYFVHVSPIKLRSRGLVWPVRLSQRLPAIRIPLRSGDEDVLLDLQDALNSAYDRAGYDWLIDYAKQPVPRLTSQWAKWADRYLRDKGVRPPKSSD